MLSGPALLLPPPFVQSVLPDAARLVDALSAFPECSWSCSIAMPFLSGKQDGDLGQVTICPASEGKL